MTGFILIVFVFMGTLAFLPILFVFCNQIDDYTAFKYNLSFLIMSAILYLSTYILNVWTGNKIDEAVMVKMFTTSVVGSVATLISFGIFNRIVSNGDY